MSIYVQCPTGRVFQYRVGSGRVLEKIPGSGSGSGRVGVLKNTIGYFRVSFLLSGNSGYSGYFRVIPGIPGNSQIICNPKHRVIPETSGNTRNFVYYIKHGAKTVRMGLGLDGMGSGWDELQRSAITVLMINSTNSNSVSSIDKISSKTKDQISCKVHLVRKEIDEMQ